MSFAQKMKDEIKALAFATLYFGSWIGVLMVLKELILAEYQIEFHGLSLALVGTLVLAKVVLVLDHVPLGAWTRTRPTWVNVLLRTALYALGVLVVLILEKAFEGRRENGGFGPSRCGSSIPQMLRKGGHAGKQGHHSNLIKCEKNQQPNSASLFLLGANAIRYPPIPLHSS
ncbi:MAG TPA: hypothetical protein VN648_30080 [Candidatus Methylomirabilis sp.]|nr:hypothetical protein [Candidatus Methylomirabilis sp.]